jgi:hypothetical protein
MTCWAMCSFSLASEMSELAQHFSALDVWYNLCPSLWKGSVCVVGAFHACVTVSGKLGSHI